MKYLIIILTLVLTGCITPEQCKEMAKEMSVTELGCSTVDGRETIRIAHLKFVDKQLKSPRTNKSCDNSSYKADIKQLREINLQLRIDLKECQDMLAESNERLDDQTEYKSTDSGPEG